MSEPERPVEGAGAPEHGADSEPDARVEPGPIAVPWPSSVTEAPHVAGSPEPELAAASADGLRVDGPRAVEPLSSVPAAPPPRRRRRSRNPVDRLTQGLPDWLRVTIDWAVTIAGAIAVVLLVKAYIVNPYRIPSASMEPTLHCARPEIGCEARFSDRVLANRFIYRLREPRRGEIVVFEVPKEAERRCGQGGTFVKRVVGLPGETIEVREVQGTSAVFIDGKKLDEPYVADDRQASGSEVRPTKIGPDRFYMMGDNRGSSCDSRVWGTVPGDNLIGKVFATYWPPNRIGLS